jgi:hypothetical protein
MKIPRELNERLKDAGRAVKQPGEPIEVYWSDDADGPWDQDRHGAWGGNFGFMADLRGWLKKHGPDGRTVTIYCRGDYRDVVLA